MMFLNFGILLLTVICLKHAFATVSPSAKAARTSNSFAYSLLHKLPTDGNNVFSPLSISLILSILYSGSSGETKRQIREHGGYDANIQQDDDVAKMYSHLISGFTINDNPCKLNIATGLFVDQGSSVKEKFKKDLTEQFDALFKQVDFQGRSNEVTVEINSWVSQATSGMIEGLFGEMSQNTIMALMNALYFKCSWKKRFNPERTFRGDFYNYGKIKTSVNMMEKSDRLKVFYSYMINLTAVELPYDGERFSMIVLLPSEDDGLARLRLMLSNDNLEEILDSMKMQQTVVQLPRFDLETEPASTDLLVYFLKLGITDLNGFKEIGEDVVVSDLIHKARIKVDEEGTEAAGATGVLMARSRPPSVDIDHPFLFLIRDTANGAILFLGEVRHL